jgi:Nucleotidyl transferase AbiEii toxin, Type IV TA system
MERLHRRPKTEPKQIEVPGLGYRPWRVALQIRYEGTEFGTTSFEVAIDEQTGGHQDLIESGAIPLGHFSIEQPGVIPCLDVAYQIAQKIHACTEPIEGGNDRVRDIVDIWLLEPLLEPADYPALRSAVAETFQRRARHTWPPPVQPSPSWAADYPKLVTSHPDAPATLTDAVAYLTTLIHRIDAPK